MSRGRPPRRVRFAPTCNVLGRVVLRVTKLTEHELEHVLTPARDSFKALREGVATELQWSILAGAVELALAIEDKGIVRGMRGHIRAAEDALHGIKLRAMATGRWEPTALYYRELDDLDEVIFLHEHQLRQLSSAEAVKALELATGRVMGDGGRVLDVRQVEGIAA